MKSAAIKHFQRAVISLVIVFIVTPSAFSNEGQSAFDAYPSKVAVIFEEQASPPLMALTMESFSYIARTFHSLGRFLPEENNRIAWALGSLKSGEKTPLQRHEEAAALLGADLLVSVSFSAGAKFTNADLRVLALNPEFKSLEMNRRVKSRIIQNIPLKLAREIACLHKDIPVQARVLDLTPDGFALINAGEWNGIRTGGYGSSKGSINILQMGRYHSIIQLPGLKKGDPITLHVHPESAEEIRRINLDLVKNTIAVHGLGSTLLKNQDDEGRFVTSTCAINMGGNVCLGGYGAFLSTHYLGFQNPSPATGGIITSTGAYVLQLTLPLMMTRFKSNFYPWVRDSDKPERIQNLQIFLWSTIPLTFTAGYFDQLAYQFHTTEHLPPFFLYRDNMAAFLSAVVPGGGLFFKGYRLPGWGYFFTEMALAGYAVYNWDRGNRGKYALSAAGVIKLMEIVNAYLIPSSYRFFNLEVDRSARDFDLSVRTRNIEVDGGNEGIIDFALERRF